ncbi:MAG: DUF4358 domain-containing protein [Oscillospiraceae bacterium]
MRKISMLVCVLFVFGLLAGCGGTSATGSDKDYREVLEASRPAELNELAMFAVTTGPDDQLYDQIFSESFGFVEADMQRYAISLGLIITQAYGVAIILPAEGKQQAVLDQVNGFIEMQRKAQENYLQDQYAIALAAKVETAETGEVLMAMCEDSETVMEKMLEGLKG